MTEPLKVLFVVGKGRSGSTLVDRLLGELPDFLSTGELWRVWGRGAVEGDACGCGQPVPDCSVWGPVLEQARGERSPVELETLRAAVMRWGRVVRVVAAARKGQASGDLAEHVQASGLLYRTLAEVTGAGVIVDSSKWPAHPGLLGLVPGIEPYGVLLVRDPRAVAFSWQRRKAYTGSASRTWMRRFPGWFSALSWVARNLVSELVAAATGATLEVVRYEDLVAHPAQTLARIASLVRVSAGDLDFLDGHQVCFGTHHTVGGNPDRMAGGVVTLREDNAWKEQMGWLDRVTVTLLTFPLLRRYGYR